MAQQDLTDLLIIFPDFAAAQTMQQRLGRCDFWKSIESDQS
jgi:hypothetical protein